MLCLWWDHCIAVLQCQNTAQQMDEEWTLAVAGKCNSWKWAICTVLAGWLFSHLESWWRNRKNGSATESLHAFAHSNRLLVSCSLTENKLTKLPLKSYSAQRNRLPKTNETKQIKQEKNCNNQILRWSFNRKHTCVIMSTAAPCCTRRCTTSLWPFCAAWCSAVKPFWFDTNSVSSRASSLMGSCLEGAWAFRSHKTNACNSLGPGISFQDVLNHTWPGCDTDQKLDKKQPRKIVYVANLENAIHGLLVSPVPARNGTLGCQDTTGQRSNTVRPFTRRGNGAHTNDCLGTTTWRSPSSRWLQDQSRTQAWLLCASQRSWQSDKLTCSWTSIAAPASSRISAHRLLPSNVALWRAVQPRCIIAIERALSV